MFKNKNYLIIVTVIILIAAIVVAISNSRKKRTDSVDQSNNLNNIDIKDVKAQSYTAEVLPALKNDDKTFGSPGAPLKIFVYEDYTNIYSAVLADTLDKIKAESGERAAVIVRPYILKSSPLALQAAIAVDCASEEGKWIEMRALLFAQTKNQELTADNFRNYARQIGLDEDKFVACLTSSQKLERIEQSAQEAENYQVQGAPTMFIGDEMILGARPYDDFIDSNGDEIEGLKNAVKRKLNQR